MLAVLLATAALVAPQEGRATVGVDTARTVRIATAPAETLSVSLRGGAGPAVVFVPGLLGSAYGFRNVLPPLVAAGYRTAVVDPLGLGASARPAEADYSLTSQARRIGQVLDTLGIERATLVCHAIGASICLRLAVQRPGLVAGIVSINGGPAERSGTPGLRTALNMASVVKVFTGDDFIRDKLREGLEESSGDPSWVTDDVLRGYTAAFGDDLDPVLRGLKEIAAAPEPAELAPNLDAIESPVLLLLGSADRDGGIPQDEIALLMQSVGTIDIDAIVGAGEYPHEEKPGDVAAAILRFLTAHAPVNRR
jgi:pimeloyl-ACP methyl ester carboxylesterase